MSFLSDALNLFADFLFPKRRRALELEALSTDEILNFPRAKDIKVDSTIVLFDYSYLSVKKLIWELKYGGNRKIAEKLGEIAYDHITDELADLKLFESASWRRTRPILVPIPISDKRRLERGWNQSELLAEQIMKRDSARIFEYLPRQLVKSRHTESQTKTSSRSKRLKNLRDSMKVIESSDVAGRCIIVIDDVTTTGSTFAEARRALRAAGAKKILCVAVAH